MSRDSDTASFSLYMHVRDMYKALAIQKIRQKYKNTDIMQDTLLM